MQEASVQSAKMPPKVPKTRTESPLCAENFFNWSKTNLAEENITTRINLGVTLQKVAAWYNEAAIAYRCYTAPCKWGH